MDPKADHTVTQPSMMADYRWRCRFLDSTIDRSMRICGYYNHYYNWRRLGVINMRTISPSNIEKELKREVARRFFETLEPVDRDKEIDKHLIDVSRVADDDIIRHISNNVFQQEVQRRQLDRVTAELCGHNPSPEIKILARCLAIMNLERAVADAQFYRLLSIPDGLSSDLARNVLRWRDFIYRKVNGTIRTLSYVRHIENSEIENALAKFKIAG